MINILIVDDDIATVEVIRDSIDWEKLNIDIVHSAYNVSGARKILEENEIDIIISDIEMPQETGLDLLKWARQEKLDCEFLFLTCHENFSYASEAINNNASAYITKPFDIDIMELNLQKIITKLKQKRSLEKTSIYGKWMEKNLRLMKLDFWKKVLEGEILEEDRIDKEIAERGLEIRSDKNYCIVYSKLSNIEADIERYGKGVVEFILEGFHSEILCDKVENESVVKFHTQDSLSYITICNVEERDNLKKKCEQLVDICKGYFKMTVTCCISDVYSIMELSNAVLKIEKLFRYYVSFHGRIFFENEVEIEENKETQIIDLEIYVSLVEKKDKAEILRNLKQLFHELTSFRKLNLYTLYLIKQEIMQVVYADLMKQGIQATKLFYDELSKKMADHATDSTIDMIRWVNYLLEKTFQYEEEIAKSVTIIDKINYYIHAHYAEEIGRNEIAGSFYLTPEYLAKLYKKRTGMSLKDYINEYRIEKAKEYLKLDEKNVSDIADLVGFPNFSYFSTIFKKITGITPMEYKKTYKEDTDRSVGKKM
jgi:Response regulator containing CheY-like receiver domain and AraC-type DNA-binding domain